MMSQIAALLKRGGRSSPIPKEYRVRRLFHGGTSQQGGSVITYATAFHFSANDGYFIQELSTARPINARPACGSDGAPPYPAARRSSKDATGWCARICRCRWSVP